MENATVSVISSGGMLAEFSGIILRLTRVPEFYVLLLFLTVLLAAMLAVRLLASDRSLHIFFGILTGVYLAGMLSFWWLDIRTLRRISSENEILEWATAAVLFVACIMAVITAVRMEARRRHGPVAVIIAGLSFVAAMREMEWMSPFFGGKIWFSRSFFRAEAYFNRHYWERFTRHMTPYERSLNPYLVHMIISCTLLVMAAVVTVYLVRRRKSLARDLRECLRYSYAWYFMIGVITFGVALTSGALARKLLESKAFVRLRDTYNLGQCMVEEPLEVVAAGCILMSSIMLHRLRLPYAEELAAGRSAG